MTPRSPVLLLALVPLLGGRAAADPPAPGEESRPYDGILPGAAPDGFAATLVLDAETGEPIAGATVRHYAEDIAPLTIAPPFLGEATTDEFGIASMPWDPPKGDHWVFEAPGRAPGYAYGFEPPREVRLVKGRTIRGRLVDPLGAPLLGAEVRLFLNCPHGPVVRRTTTDAAGTFALEHVDVHARYPQSLALPGTRGRDDGEWMDVGDFLELGDALVTYAARASVDVVGTVVDPEGKPVEGCVVRGPRWYDVARTGADGTFRLRGLARETTTAFFHPAGQQGRELFETADGFEPGFPLRVVLPRSPPPVVEGDAPWRTVTVRVQSEESGRALADVPVRLVEERTGRVHDDGSAGEERGSVVFEMPEGTYAVMAGTPLSRWWSAADGPRGVVVRGDTVVDVSLPERQARLRTHLLDVPANAAITLAAAGYERVLRTGGGDDETSVDPDQVFLPRECPASLRVEAQGLCLSTPVGPDADGVRSVEVRWPAPARIRLKIAGDVTVPAPSFTFDVERRPDEIVLRTHARGALSVGLWRKRDETAQVDVIVPDEPGAEVTVSEVTFAAETEGRLSVLLPDGSAAEDAEVVLPDGGGELLDAAGRATSEGFRDGARISVSKDGFARLDARLEGAGPYGLRWGPATLGLRVTADRQPVDFVIWLDAHLYDGAAGQLVLRGLEPGLHTLVIGAAGRRGRVERVLVPARGERALEVDLPAR
jgi:hypothetical protein